MSTKATSHVIPMDLGIFSYPIFKLFSDLVRSRSVLGSFFRVLYRSPSYKHVSHHTRLHNLHFDLFDLLTSDGVDGAWDEMRWRWRWSLTSTRAWDECRLGQLFIINFNGKCFGRPYLEVSPTRSMLFHRLCINTIRLPGPARPAMTEIKMCDL